MPRKSARTQNTTQNSSQLSQTRIEEHLSPLSQSAINEKVNNCVRYFVNNAGQNAYFRKADVQKYCTSKAGQNLQQVIESATAILQNVYGYKVLVCDQAANVGKAFVVSNALPHKDYRINKNQPDNNEVKKILLLLILSHIYMSNPPVLEASLHSFLNHLKIDVNVRHPLFGNIKDYLNSLVKQKFLVVETDPVTKKVTYSWGIRSEKEISKHEILKFVCKMYKDRQPQSWTNQLRLANEQCFENDRNLHENGMEVED